MNEKDLKKLTRAELLEMLLIQSRDNLRLQKEVERLELALEERQLNIERAGSIAEAALQINGVFDAAQRAAEQYLTNLAQMSGRQEEICNRMMEETRKKCDEMVEKARRESQQYWEQISERMHEFYRSHPGLNDMTEAALEQQSDAVFPPVHI